MISELRKHLTASNFFFLKGNDQFIYEDVQSLFAIDENSSGGNNPISYTGETGNLLPDLSSQEWRFGFVSYDFKNRLEKLHSNNTDRFHFRDFLFFQPTQLMVHKAGEWKSIIGDKSLDVSGLELEGPPSSETPPTCLLKPRFSRKEYLDRVLQIKTAIRLGDIYELNFCQEFYAEDTVIDPIAVFERLNRISPAPFAAFCRFGDNYVISSSPERFLKKTGNTLLAQPIKGTRPRSADPREDSRLKEELRMDEKERAENVMIVDLVRNDLSRIASKGSVKVEELFGVYSFEQVHQLISSISANVKPGTTFADILQATFPMGSMTGAPKVRAMQLIDELENTRRGLYSGTLGFITPEGDFDFSVVIRTIFYNASTKYLSFQVGSAITDKSDPEQEYQECLLKAKALVQALNGEIKD